MKEEVLRFRSLMKAANEGKLFSDIEMQVCKGEIIGLRSDNNGIAQALLRIIAGTDRPNSGSVYIDGARYAFDDAATLLRNVDYDKEKVIEYLMSGKRIAGCPKNAMDCVTGERISDSFSVYSDGEYDWCDFLIYHIRKYNIVLPMDFINKIGA